MTLSEVLYEAACIMSDDVWGEVEYSCFAVDDADPMSEGAREQYCELMNDGGSIWTDFPGRVERAARTAGWSDRDFRTFMLLMASEAVK